MHLKTECPRCHAMHKVNDSLLGKRVKCPKCQQSFEVLAVQSGSTQSLEKLPQVSELSAESLHAAPSSKLQPQKKEQLPISSLGRFAIIRELGRGGFGVVYLANDPQLGRQVALKVPTFSKLDRSYRKRLQRFLDEAKAVAKLRHPNIVGVFETGEVNDNHGEPRYYISTEYIEGETLESHLKRGLPSVEQAAQWVKQLAEALGYAHDEAIVHRDIKPGNIMIEAKSQRPMLLDFGLAKRVGEDGSPTLDGSVLGTPAYMSFEQASGLNTLVGPASDQYSLGVVLFELLTGQVPFKGENPQETMALIMHGEAPSPSRFKAELPKDLVTICLKCLQKERGRRFTSSQELALEIERYRDGIPILSRPITPVERFYRWCLRHPVIVGLAATILLVATIGLVVATGLRAQVKRKDEFLQAQDIELQKRRDELTSLDSQITAGTEALEKSRAELKRVEEEKKNAQEEQRWTKYVADIYTVSKAFGDGDFSLVTTTLAAYDNPNDNSGSDPRGIEWYYWNELAKKQKDTLLEPSVSGPFLFSSNNQWLATTSYHLWVWQVGTRKLHFSAPMCDLSKTPPGREIMKVKESPNIGVDNVIEVKEDVCFSSDNKLVASVQIYSLVKRVYRNRMSELVFSSAGAIRVWRLGDSKMLWETTDVENIQGDRIRFDDDSKHVLVMSSTGEWQARDANSGIATKSDNSDYISSSEQSDYRIELTEQKTLKINNKTDQSNFILDNRVSKFAQRGSFVVSGDETGAVRLWNLTERKLVFESTAHEGPVYNLQLGFGSPPSYIVSSGGERGIAGTTRLFSLNTNDTLALPKEIVPSQFSGGRSRVECFNGKDFAEIVNGNVRVTSSKLPNGSMTFPREPMSGSIFYNFSPSGKYFVIDLKEGNYSKMSIWDLEAAKEIAKVHFSEFYKFSNNEKYLYLPPGLQYNRPSGRTGIVLELPSGKVTHEFKPSKKKFSPNGKYLVGNEFENLNIYETISGKLVKSLPNADLFAFNNAEQKLIALNDTYDSVKKVRHYVFDLQLDTIYNCAIKKSTSGISQEIWEEPVSFTDDDKRIIICRENQVDVLCSESFIHLARINFDRKVTNSVDAQKAFAILIDRWKSEESITPAK